jgi:hypothetical protein
MLRVSFKADFSHPLLPINNNKDDSDNGCGSIYLCIVYLMTLSVALIKVSNEWMDK